MINFPFERNPDAYRYAIEAAVDDAPLLDSKQRELLLRTLGPHGRALHEGRTE